jgi:hypothetical protein
MLLVIVLGCRALNFPTKRPLPYTASKNIFGIDISLDKERLGHLIDRNILMVFEIP